MDVFRTYLKESAKHLQIADHMIYVTLPIVNEKRLLIKILEEIYKSVLNSLYSLLSYEQALGRVSTLESDEIIDTLLKIAKKTLSHEHSKKIKEILTIHQKHQQSAMEFVRREKVIIMSDRLSVEGFDLRRIKEYLLVAKELFLTVSKKSVSPDSAASPKDL